MTVTLLRDGGDVFTPSVLALVDQLHTRHGALLSDLLAARGSAPALERAPEDGWRVAEPPAWLSDRRCEITGPADPSMAVGALNSGARVFLADLEDALSPTWPNLLAAYGVLRDAAAGTLVRTRPDGSVDRVREDAAALVTRPRGLHLPEPRILVDGVPARAPLVDVAVVAVHTAKAWLRRGRGLGLYLPKLEHAAEAAWWHRVLLDVERAVDVPAASTPVTVLVETLPLALQMPEVLHALRERPAALNAGRWDYLFSTIKNRPDDVLPDRVTVTMTTPFLAAYAARLVAVCHAHGAQAIGGMSAVVPDRKRPDVTARALEAVRADKQREADLGYDGTWVAHPDLVGVATEVFSGALGARVDQRHVQPAVGSVHPLLDLHVDGSCTRAGLVNDVDVALRYLTAWLSGRGAVAVHGLMEDVATAEVARCQLWQWQHAGVTLDDGTVVTRKVVTDAVLAGAAALDGVASDLVTDAVAVLLEGCAGEELPAFLTLLGLGRLDARHP